MRRTPRRSRMSWLERREDAARCAEGPRPAAGIPKDLILREIEGLSYSGNRRGAGAGARHRQIAHQPRANTFAQFLSVSGNFFENAASKSYRM